jgi:hypothetical protein
MNNVFMFGIVIVLIVIIGVCIRIILVAADTAPLAPNVIAVNEHQSVRTVKLAFVK